MGVLYLCCVKVVYISACPILLNIYIAIQERKIPVLILPVLSFKYFKTFKLVLFISNLLLPEGQMEKQQGVLTITCGFK